MTIKLVHLPGTTLTPEVVLHRTLQEVNEIASIAVIVEWKNEAVTVDWSEQTAGKLAVKSAIMHGQAYQQLFQVNE